MLTINLTAEEINEIDLSPLAQYINWSKNNKYFNLNAGQEHYKLLALLSKKLKCKKFVDIGHYHGFSSVAMSFSGDKVIESYDIFNWLPDDGSMTSENLDNINLHIEDYLEDIPKMMKDTDFIMIDIDHTGVTERLIMEQLEKNKYKGIVFLDDINLNEEMRKFWADIKLKKIDVTPLGHWSGSGIVIFDPSRFDITIETPDV